MFHPIIKRLFLTYCLISLPIEGSTNQIDEERANQQIRQLYQSVSHIPKSDMPSRINSISAQLLGKPYLLGALGEGAQGQYDQRPLFRFDAFDCETFVDTVLALVLANNPITFKQSIRQIRYRNGHVSFITRNHFTCLDWNQNNQQNSFLKDITLTFRNEHNQPVARFAQALIDKPNWYQHFSIKNIHLKNQSTAEQANRLQVLKTKGSNLPKTVSMIPYIPLSALFDGSGKPNETLFNQIPNGAIIEIIRPNWDLSEQIGTHLNVSHLGFAIKNKGMLFFREASSKNGYVIDTPLKKYLFNAQKSPTIKGINIQIMLPV